MADSVIVLEQLAFMVRCRWPASAVYIRRGNDPSATRQEDAERYVAVDMLDSDNVEVLDSRGHPSSMRVHIRLCIC